MVDCKLQKVHPDPRRIEYEYRFAEHEYEHDGALDERCEADRAVKVARSIPQWYAGRWRQRSQLVGSVPAARSQNQEMHGSNGRRVSVVRDTNSVAP